MAQAVLGKWGKTLAIRLPAEIVKAANLRTGERVEVEARGGDIVIRRPGAEAAADALAAAEEIIRESDNYALDGVTIRELLDEGRRE